MTAARAAFRGRDAYRAWCPLNTRWADNDVYGHVNNTVYYEWFDTAVNGWLVAQGLLDPVAGDPIGLVVETGCRYARPLTFPEAVEVGLAVAAIGRSSVTFHLGVFGAKRDAAAEGHFIHVYVDRTTRRPVALSEKWRAKLESLRA